MYTAWRKKLRYAVLCCPSLNKRFYNRLSSSLLESILIADISLYIEHKVYSIDCTNFSPHSLRAQDVVNPLRADIQI